MNDVICLTRKISPLASVVMLFLYALLTSRYCEWHCATVNPFWYAKNQVVSLSHVCWMVSIPQYWAVGRA